MSDITFADLPEPPAGRVGWPWTSADAFGQRNQSQALIDLEDAASLPAITVVTPSFNQATYLEETIRSVLLQSYPRLEYIVIDGGSTDGSVEIIERYSRWLRHWESRRDDGQAHAIMKGLELASGEWFNFINSDDLLSPGALHLVASLSGDADVVAGTCLNFGMNITIGPIRNVNLTAAELIDGASHTMFHQPAVWLKRASIKECGGIDTAYRYIFDWVLMVRYLAKFPRVAYTEAVLARFRGHETSKTVAESSRFEHERRAALRQLRDNLPPGNLQQRCNWRLREFEWWEQLERLQQTAPHGGLRKVEDILRLALKDPRVRFSRLAAGAIREALFGSGH